jgi:hypothetical protein
MRGQDENACSDVNLLLIWCKICEIWFDPARCHAGFHSLHVVFSRSRDVGLK